MKTVLKLGLALFAATAYVMSSQAVAQEKLTVWWVRGFYKSEDDALFAAIKKYEDKSGVKVELSQYPVQDMIPKTVAALDAGTPPDVAYADVYDFQVTGKWAFDGKLEDVTDIITPIKDKFLKNTIETTYLYNDKTKKKAYYAIPMKQQTMHIQYWKDMLAEAGYKESDIPTTWKAYWDFWCDKVQPAHRTKTGKRTYAIGQPMGVDSSDSFYSFLTFMDAYNVKLVDDNGKLLVDDPKVRAGLINALRDYTSIRTRGCTPPSSTSWKDPDNNVSFHNKTILLTHNATISIAAKWLDDANNATLTPEQRAQAKKNYDELIATAGFPNKPDGSKFVYRAAVKTARDLRRRQEQEAREGIRHVHDAGREPAAVRRRLARPLVPGHQVRHAKRVLAGRPGAQGRVQPVRRGHGDLRIHEELQVHGAQQRERLGEGDEPRRQRQRHGRKGHRRDDRPHQAGRGLLRQTDPAGVARSVGRRRRAPNRNTMATLALPDERPAGRPAPPGKACRPGSAGD